jgi:hypothetical protein
MDHDDVLEELELAAVEPGGIERLTAGDTPQAAAVASHLAGCDTCTTELERLRRSAPLLRDVIRTTPPPDLRDRTLAFVRERGIERGASAPAVLDAPATHAVVRAPGRRGSVLPWAAAIAAAVVISVGVTSIVVNNRIDSQLAVQQAAIDAQAQTIEQLGYLTGATLSVTSQPDLARVPLEPSDGATAAGTLLFSPDTTELVVVATGLTRPPAGQEYRCWVERDGVREPIGKMFFGGDLAYWAGDAASVADLPAGSTFGVSLAEVDGTALDAPPVMAGSL